MTAVYERHHRSPSATHSSGRATSPAGGGDLDGARRAHEAAFETALRASPREVFIDRMALVGIYVRQGDLPAAREHTRHLEASYKKSNNSQVAGSIKHAQGLIAEAEGRHVEAVTKLVDSAEQFAALRIPSWVARVIDDLAECTSVDADSRHQLHETAAALRAGTLDLSDVMPTVNEVCRV